MTRLYRKRPRTPTCSLCRVRHGVDATVVLHFQLTRVKYREDGSMTMRGAGAIDLCEPCWTRVTRAAAIRRRPERPPAP